MNKDFIEQLILSKDYSQLSAKELESLKEWVNDEQEYLELKAAISVAAKASDHSEKAPDFLLKNILQQLPAENLQVVKKTKRTLLYALTAVAASIILIATITFLLQHKNEEQQAGTIQEKNQATTTPQQEKTTTTSTERKTNQPEIQTPQEQKNVVEKLVGVFSPAPAGDIAVNKDTALLAFSEKSAENVSSDVNASSTTPLSELDDTKKENLTFNKSQQVDQLNYMTNAAVFGNSASRLDYSFTSPGNYNLEFRKVKAASVSSKLSDNKEFTKISLELY